MSAKRGNNERDFLLTIIVLIIIGFYAAVKDERHIRDKRYKHLKKHIAAAWDQIFREP